MAIEQLELYQLMPPLTEEEYSALKADIRERGILVPIELDELGHILDGHHRMRAWGELQDEGVTLPDYPRVVRGGMTEQEKRNHVRALNLLRRQLSKEQRETQWAEMRKDGMTYQAIADASGVSENTVRNSVPQNCGTQPTTVTGKDGKKYPPKKKRKKKKPPQTSFFATSEVAEKKAKAAAQKAAESDSSASQQTQVTIFSSESKEYYTPPQYIEAARQVMGDIDLDPASNERAQEWINAGTFYTAGDDGLSQSWHGRVWLNPPYGTDKGQSNQGTWAQRLIEEYQAGNVTEGILLVKAALGYNWFEDLWIDWPVCFARERLSFIKADGSSDGQSKMGTAFFYLGSNTKRFHEVFRSFGRVIMPEGE
jgi:ParB-like chromosome segregation protein Spo0J